MLKISKTEDFADSFRFSEFLSAGHNIVQISLKKLAGSILVSFKRILLSLVFFTILNNSCKMLNIILELI